MELGLTSDPFSFILLSMETIEIKLDQEEIEVLRASKLNLLLPQDGTIETAILNGIIWQILKDN